MGTHPIFESDFDCLSDKRETKKKWHRRKRKALPERVPTPNPNVSRNRLRQLSRKLTKRQCMRLTKLARSTSSGVNETLKTSRARLSRNGTLPIPASIGSGSSG